MNYLGNVPGEDRCAVLVSRHDSSGVVQELSQDGGICVELIVIGIVLELPDVCVHPA